MTTRRPKVIKENLAEAERRIEQCRDSREPKLDLTYLSLRHLPDSVRDLVWLQYLNISFNGPIEIPDWIGELTELGELWLLRNSLEIVPETLGRMRNLRRLGITGGRLSAARDEVRCRIFSYSLLRTWIYQLCPSGCADFEAFNLLACITID